MNEQNNNLEDNDQKRVGVSNNKKTIKEMPIDKRPLPDNKKEIYQKIIDKYGKDRINYRVYYNYKNKRIETKFFLTTDYNRVHKISEKNLKPVEVDDGLANDITKLVPNKQYKKYHLPTYSRLEDVEQYRFISDVVSCIRDAIINQKKDNQYKTLIKRNTAIFSLGYLTASRPSELSKVTLKDIRIYKNELNKHFVKVSLTNLKNRKTKAKHVIFPYKFNKQEFIIFKYILKWWIVLANRILKNYEGITWKDYLTRSDKIPKERLELLDAEMGSNYLFTRITVSKQKRKITIYKNPLSRPVLNNIFNNYINHNPHFFRKLRATHLYSIYGFSLKQLQKYLGHSDIRSSTPYTFIDISGMENNFIEVDPK